METRFLTLGEISIGGKGSYGIGASAVEFSDELPTYLRITDINDDGTLNRNDLKSVDTSEYEKYLLKENDIVFARTGASTGRRYYYDPRDGEFVFAGFLIKFSLDPLKVFPKYVKYYTASEDYCIWVKASSTGSTRGNLNAQDYARMPVELPPYADQKAIVGILGALDDKIELNRKINENLEAIAQALFKSWFIDFDPVRAKAEGRDTGLPEHISSLFPSSFVDSELGQIPEGWKVSSLSDAVGFIKGKKPITTSKVKGEGFSPQILIETFDTGKFIYADREGMVIASSEDVLMVMDGASSGRIERGYSGIVGSTLSIVSSKALPRTYLYSYLKTLQEDIQSNTTGSAIPHTDKARVLSYRTALPNQGILKAFDKVVKQSFDRVIVSREEIKMLIFLRDTLLPKLISGELPIPDAERIVGRYL